MLVPRIWNDNFFNNWFNDFAPAAPKHAAKPDMNLMKTDVKETEDGFVVEIDLPGYKKEDVNAGLQDGYLTVTATRSGNNDEKDEEGKYIRRERYQGTCSRSYYVGEDITEDDIKAKFENGILSMSIPKKEQKQVEEKKYIAIEG